MLYEADISISNLSFTLNGKTADGEKFEFDYPSGKFNWKSAPTEPYDVIEDTLRGSLNEFAKKLEYQTLNEIDGHTVNYRVHP